jgi:FKBP-type peptidyl-prolyl cis-trans isomerase SlyD
MVKKKVANGKTVSIAYRVTDEQGNELDRAEEKNPFSYTHGAGEIVPGLEAALTNLSVGETCRVTVPPKDAYGESDPSLRFYLRREVFPPDAAIAPGMVFAASGSDGAEEATFRVVSAEGQRILVDGNHPLAGRTLVFDVTVLSVDEEPSNA